MSEAVAHATPLGGGGPTSPEASANSRRSKRRRIASPTTGSSASAARAQAEEVIVIDSDDDGAQPAAGPSRSSVRPSPRRLSVVDMTNEEDDDAVEVVEIRPTPAPSGLAAVAREQSRRVWERERQRTARQREAEAFVAHLTQRATARNNRAGAPAQGGGGGPLPPFDLGRVLIGMPPGRGGAHVRRNALHHDHPLMPPPLHILLMLGGRLGDGIFAHLQDLGGAPRPNNGATEEQIRAIPTHTMPNSKKRARRDDGQEGEEDDELTCTVCQEEMKPGEKVSTLPCSHQYHTKCINQWLKNKKTCCLCNRDVTS